MTFDEILKDNRITTERVAPGAPLSDLCTQAEACEFDAEDLHWLGQGETLMLDVKEEYRVYVRLSSGARIMVETEKGDPPTRLIQLPNGDWIDPFLITSISFEPRDENFCGSGLTVPDRLSIQTGAGERTAIKIVHCSSRQEALAARGELAAKVNAAHAAKARENEQ